MSLRRSRQVHGYQTWPAVGRSVRSRCLVGADRLGWIWRDHGQRGDPAFVPIVTEAVPVAKPGRCVSSPAAIEIKLAGAVVRVVSGTDAALLSEVLRAVRASATLT